VFRPSDTNVILLLIGVSILGIFAGVTCTGIGSTWLLKETENKSLVELSCKKQQDFIYGRLISCIWFDALTL
jgi:hypothetical protein